MKQKYYCGYATKGGTYGRCEMFTDSPINSDDRIIQVEAAIATKLRSEGTDPEGLIMLSWVEVPIDGG